MPNPESIISRKGKPPSEDEMKTAFDKKYDPYDMGMEDGYGLWGAVVHIIRLTFGAGILLLPYTMKTVGYVNGTILLALVSGFYYHNMHILISHEYRLCKLLQVKQITYSSLVERTFENTPFPLNKVGVLISRVLLLYFCMTAYTCTYLLVFADSVQNLAKYFDYNLHTTQIITVTMIPILIFSMFRRLLKILVPFSAVTNFFSLVMAIVLVTCCIIYRNPEATARPFGELNFVPQTFAVYIQAFICTSSILPVKNYMKQPRRLGAKCGSLNISAVTLTFLFVNFALISYFCFGDNVEENILSNLPKNNFLSFVIFLLYAIAMFVIYLLSFSVTFDNVWPEVERRLAGKRFKTIIEFSIRIGLNAWAYLLAVGIPNLTLIMTISGTLAITLEVALIPGLELVLAFKSKKKRPLIIIKDLVIISVSAVLFYMSLVDCIQEVQKMHSE